MSNLRLTAAQPGDNPGKAFSSTTVSGGFSMAHQIATTSWSSRASFPDATIISLVRSKNELVKWVRGALAELVEDRRVESNVGSICWA